MASFVHATLPAQAAAGATINVELGEVPSDWRFGTENQITLVRVTSPALVTGVVTNNATITVRRFRAGVLIGIIATITLNSGVNLPAETNVDIPVTDTRCAPGDVLECQMIQNGTGIALPQGIGIQVEIAP